MIILLFFETEWLASYNYNFFQILAHYGLISRLILNLDVEKDCW